MRSLKHVIIADTGEGLKSVFPAGLAGAYDIGMHYAYEEGRGVAFLSTMARAMGGQKVFASQSPAVVFNAIADAQGVRRGKQSVAAG